MLRKADASPEEIAWDRFWESVDGLRAILRERGMEFTVKWEMTARSKPKPKSSARSGDVKP